jgi:hypothetical protein
MKRHIEHFPCTCSSGAFGAGTEDEIQGAVGGKSSDEAKIRALEQNFSDAAWRQARPNFGLTWGHCAEIREPARNKNSVSSAPSC